MEPPREHSDATASARDPLLALSSSVHSALAALAPRLSVRSCTRGAEYPARYVLFPRHRRRPVYANVQVRLRPESSTRLHHCNDLARVGFPILRALSLSAEPRTRLFFVRGELVATAGYRSRGESARAGQRHESRNTHDDRRPTTDNGYAASESSWKGGGRREGGHVRGKRGSEGERERERE